MARRTADSVTSRPSACFRWEMVASSGFEQLVGLDGQLRNLARTGQLRAAAPVAIAAQGIDVGQNPGSHNKIGLFAGLAQQIQPYRYAIGFKAHQQFFGKSNVLGRGSTSGVPRRPQQTMARRKTKTAASAGKDKIQSLQSRCGRPLR